MTPSKAFLSTRGNPFIPLLLPIGVGRDEVLKALVKQLREIADKLKGGGT